MKYIQTTLNISFLFWGLLIPLNIMSQAYDYEEKNQNTTEIKQDSTSQYKNFDTSLNDIDHTYDMPNIPIYKGEEISYPKFDAPSISSGIEDESPLFNEPFKPTKMAPIITVDEINNQSQQTENNYTSIILFFMFGITFLIILFASINDVSKIKISIVSIIGIFAITASITHIWTVIIAFSNAGLWGGLLTLFLPFLGELYWMIKMFGVNDLYAYIALIHLILTIPIALLRN